MTEENALSIIRTMIDGANDNDILKRRIHFNMLYDFYSPLLTERQRKVYKTLCFSDLTLSEAAKLLRVSRQAVHILVRNVCNKLEDFEQKVRFVENTKHLEERIKMLEEENGSLRAKLRNREEDKQQCLKH